MTITSELHRIAYDGDDSTVEFSYPYRFLADADLVVILTDDVAETDTEQTLATHYTVSGEGDAGGGTVTMLTAPTSDQHLTIYVDPALTQPTDYSSGDAFPAESHETALDRLTLITQRSRELAARTPNLPDADVDGSGAYDANGNLISDLGTPVAAADATTKAYVDQAILDAGSGGLGAITILNANVDDDADIDVDKLDDYQASTAEKRLETDPTSGLAVGFENEIRQQRGQLTAITGGTYWYTAPVETIVQLAASKNALKRFVSGFECSAAGAVPTPDLTIGAGARGMATSGGLVLVLEGGAMVKETDATWAAGTAAGGWPSDLDAGSPTADKWYHCFAIAKPDGTVDYAFDDQLDASTILGNGTIGSGGAGYTYAGFVCSFLMDSGPTNIVGFRQARDEFWWYDPILDYTTLSAPDDPWTLIPLQVPLGRRVQAICNVTGDHSSGIPFLFSDPLGQDEDPTLSSAPLAHTGALSQATQIKAWTDTSKRIGIRAGSAGKDADVSCQGWIDNRAWSIA